jgi:1,4-alpha-glucan branching enzyme
MTHKVIPRNAITLLFLAALLSTVAWAQATTPAAQPAPPVVISPEVSKNRQITFRLLAPQAENVRLTGGDMPGIGQGKPMTKGEKDIWEITVGPISTSTAWR